ncbi:DUF3450 domain-containing protein [Desulfovibrio sp. UCD-KL4C]|uniref:DUF3450 domain-containing protein n=1 Tax=Desulfovibrio sp. UCD-KL4C TaxID=2578120 RepID=UPI0025BFB652|nr:DUF3450 domain-containing protein [Desulfovibrio sp. UCD-KL4C]
MNKLVFLPLALLLLLTVSAMASSKVEAVHEQASKAIAIEAKAQRLYRNWTDIKERKADEIREMKATEDWLKFQEKKYNRYIQKQEEVIAELIRRKEEAKRINMELEPFLDTIVDQLESFVKADLPFLSEERERRIHFLQNSLDDYHLELSEKLRRVFEALLIETEYGQNVSTTTQELEINGIKTQASIFRLGRTALFYQTTDGLEIGIWDKKSGSWKTLNPTYSHALRRAKDMADRKRAVELLELPLGATK